MKILESKKMVDIKILASTEEDWTPEWADSVSESTGSIIKEKQTFW